MTLTVQFQTLLSMIAAGIGIGICFDTYSRFLKRPNKFHLGCFFIDLLFWIVQAAGTFLLLLYVNEGELRFYLFIALLLGYATYQALFKVVYLKILERVIYFTIKIATSIKKLFIVLLIRPLLVLWGILVLMFINIVKFLIKIGFLIYRMLFYCIKLLYKIILFFIPNKFKKYLLKYAGMWEKIKNKLSIMDKVILYIKKFNKK